MDFWESISISVCCLAFLAFCGFVGWKRLTAKNNEWLNTREPLNMIVKGALSVVLGWLFLFWEVFKFTLRMIRFLPLPF